MQMSGENPYQAPVAEAILEVRCRAAKVKLKGTRCLDATNGVIQSEMGELRFGIVPDKAFPISILIAGVMAFWSPLFGVIGYVGSYFLAVAFFSRPASIQLKDGEVTVDTKRDLLAIQKRRKGWTFTIAFAITPECYRLLPKLNLNIIKEELQETSNFNWHLLALLVMIGSASLRLVL